MIISHSVPVYSMFEHFNHKKVKIKNVLISVLLFFNKHSEVLNQRINYPVESFWEVLDGLQGLSTEELEWLSATNLSLRRRTISF